MCVCAYVCISGGSCDDAHGDGGNAGGGEGGWVRQGRRSGLAKLFVSAAPQIATPVLTHSLLSPGDRSAAGTVHHVLVCVFCLQRHHLPTA